MNWSFNIGSILGIPVRVHFTFILLLLLVFFVGQPIIGAGGLSGVVLIVLVFASVVIHELSHSMVARHFGVNVVDITLLPIGGMARISNPPDKPVEEILIAIAGPAASLILAFLLWFAGDIFGQGPSISEAAVETSLLAQLALVNLALGLFNLLPAFPMDGGRVLRGLLGLSFSPYKATRIAVGVGQGLAVALFFVGLIWMNVFMILIALFVYVGAETEERQMGLMSALKGMTARTAMVTNVKTLLPGDTVGDAAEIYCHGFQSDFPVMDGRRVLGLVTRDLITEALHKRGSQTLLQDVMARDFPTVLEDTPLAEVMGKMQEWGRPAVPVIQGAELKGLITVDQIVRYNMLCSGYSCEFMQTSKTHS